MGVIGTAIANILDFIWKFILTPIIDFLTPIFQYVIKILGLIIKKIVDFFIWVLKQGVKVGEGVMSHVIKPIVKLIEPVIKFIFEKNIIKIFVLIWDILEAICRCLYRVICEIYRFFAYVFT